MKGGVIKPNLANASKPSVLSAAKPAVAQPSMIKKPTPAPGIGANGASVAAAGKKPVLTVATNTKKNDLGVQTLVGDYEEMGSNHGKKYYKKVQEIPGHKDVKVFLYYWDNRDGADSAGWWFGDQLGGSEVWARAVSVGNIPPAAGWRVPWNAPKPEPGLLTVTPYKGPAPAATPAVGPAAAKIGITPAAGIAPAKIGAIPAAGAAATKIAAPSATAADPRVKKATSQVEVAENAAKAVVTKAKTLTKDSPAEALKLSQETLQKQQEKLAEIQKSLTQDMTEARKAGPSGIASATEISKLSPRIRTSTTTVTTELNRIKALAQTKAPNPAELKKLEEKHKKEYEDSLPALETAVSAVTEAVDSAQALANPIISELPETVDDELKKTLDQIEKGANAAQIKLNETKQKVTLKLQAIKNYAQEARKTATAKYTSFNTTLTEEQKKLDPLKTLKRDFSKRVEAKKALSEITEKISNAELEVEKATMMTSGADEGSQMSEEDVKSGEELVKTAQTALGAVRQLIDVKLKTATGPMKDELSSMRNRLGQSHTKVTKITGFLKKHREGLSLQSVYTEGHEKVDKAEEIMSKCGEAELPFLKGIEVLPQEESDKAIQECEGVATEASGAVNAARSFLTQKMQEIKKYSKETQATATEELTDLQKRLEELSKKLLSFKKDTQERKVAAVMSESVDAVMAAETKAKALAAAEQMFSASKVESSSVEDLKEAIEKATNVDKECSAAVTEARKHIALKQKVAAKDKELAAGLSKLTNRVNAIQTEIAKVKKAAAMGETVVKGKELSTDLDAKLSAIETEVDNVVKLSKPEDDGLGIEKTTDESVLEICGKLGTFDKDLKPIQSSISTFQATAPVAMKATFIKLSERCKAAVTKVTEVKTSTKDQREKVLSGVYVKESAEKVAEVESAQEKLGEAELPYLKGVEVLPLEESRTSIKNCEEAAALVTKSIADARQAIASKSMELKKFAPANSKAAVEDIGKLTERINAVGTQLGQFKKDTESRKKTALLQEAGEKVNGVEAEVEKVIAFMKPLAEKDPDAMSSEDAAATMKSLEDLEHSAQANIHETRNFLLARQKESGAEKDKAAKIKELQTKLQEQTSELGTAKKSVSTFIDKIKGKAVLQDGGEKLKEVEAEIAKATSACAPLLEEKGERFLVKQSIATVATALRTHMAEKNVSVEDMHKEVGDKQNDFVAFVASMPEKLQREECSFKEARRAAMFKSVDADGDGVVSLEEFKAMLLRRFVCVSSITVTDVYDIAESKSLCKVEKGGVVESLAEAKTSEDGVSRLQCKVVSTGEEGWVTMSGNAGTKYLELSTAFADFSKELDSSLSLTTRNVNKLMSWFGAKTKELATAAKDSPLVAAKEDLGKLNAKVQAHVAELNTLKKSVQEAKVEYSALELKEKNAHIEAKEQQEADAILVVAQPLVTTMEAEFAKLDELCKPLLEKVGTELLAEFATPLSVLEEAKKMEVAIKSAVQEAKEACKKQMELVVKATKGPLLQAKKDIQKWTGESSKTQGSAVKLLTNVKNACNTIADTKVQLVAASLRADLQSKSLSVEDYFAKLASSGEKIPEEAFCTHIKSLDGSKLLDEHAKLVIMQIDADGVSRPSFMRLVQEYMKVVKDIAITPNFEITDTKEKMVRKACVDEIFEVLLGPKSDEASGLERVKVRALSDGAEGWISVKGNQGRQFLEKTDKPCYTCLKEIEIGKEFKTGGDPVRTLKPEEVVEVLEGPRVEIVGCASRARVKASKDGKIGFVTITDEHGTTIVEKNSTIYTCSATVAITDVFDINACKVLKKMGANEVFTVSEGPIAEGGMNRVKGKSQKDDVEGWITITGNAGTVFAKLNEKLYTVRKEVAMLTKFGSDSPAVRTLEVDEALEVLDPPKEEKFPPVERVKIRASSDGATGWVQMKGQGANLKKWSPVTKVMKAATLYTSQGMKESVVRELAVGELMQMFGGPLEQEGDLWVKGKMKKDGAVGWALIKDESGARLLGPAQ